MKPEQIRIAVAELHGWRLMFDEAVRIKYNGQKLWLPPHCKSFNPMDDIGEARDICGLPDYLNDLNAIQSAVLSLPPEKHTDYEINLIAACCGENVGYGPDGEIEDNTWLVFNATAVQRCEALLRALNLWRE